MDINIKEAFEEMRKMNAGVMKVIDVDKKGRKTRAIILIEGIEETEEIIEAIIDIEDSWS